MFNVGLHEGEFQITKVLRQLLFTLNFHFYYMLNHALAVNMDKI